jgi:hypothetical protein
MSDLRHSESIVIDAAPEAVYDLVCDVTRTGEWSPVCKECWWDEGATGTAGDMFTGRNVLGDQSWETRCTVIAAERGREFGWVVGDHLVRWAYELQADADGTRLTEHWELLPGGVQFFHDRFGADAEAQMASRIELAHSGITETLRAVKGIAEGA